MISESILKIVSMYWDGGQTMIPSFDQLVVVWLLLIVVLGGMRLFYGAWPWEASKTWYRTRQAVDYVEALRAEKKPLAVQPLQDAGDISAHQKLMTDAVDTSTLRQLLNGIDSRSDSFDRSLVFDDSAPEVTPQSPETGTPSAKKDSEKQPLSRRAWLKSSRRKKPIQATESALLKRSDSGQPEPLVANKNTAV
jgi:hypothetical protein